MYVIDRFEGNIAVCEDLESDEMVDIAAEELPIEAREGDVIVKAEGNQTYSIDNAETEKKKARIHEKMKRLWNRT